MLKRIVLVVVAIALVVPVGLAGVWLWGQVAGPAMAQTSTMEAKPTYNPVQTITVVGHGSVRVEPDIARISIGVENVAETVGEAVAQNGTQMNAILAALKEAGVAEKDIQTMQYSISFERYPEPMPRLGTEAGEPKPQYRVSNMVNVTVRKLDTVDDVLDAVVEAGANNIWGVSFSLDNPDSAEAEARADAIADAKTRAEALAELSEVTLGPVMAVSEVISGSPIPMAMDTVERAMAAGAGSIAPGELEIGYQVQVTYFIEP